MPKNKRPAPRKPAQPAAEPDHEAVAQNLVDLALEVTEREGLDPATVASREEDVLTLVRRSLRRRHDDVLYGAIELARYTDPAACRWLRERIEEEAATLRVRDGGAGAGEAAPELEIDAFMVPLFVHSDGGLVEGEVFADDAAFEELTESFRRAGLASADTKVVLVRHLYDLAEVDAIRYSELQEILREAAQALRSKKLVATPALEATMRGWQDDGDDEDDQDGDDDDDGDDDRDGDGDRDGAVQTVQLRFLFGFALKRADDPFYRVPGDEAGADAYFEGRMARYRMWAGSIAPLLTRCLSAHPAGMELNFLYQDLFYGAKEQGIAELGMLATLSEVNERIDGQDRPPERLKAVVAPVDLGDHAALRINLYPLDGGAPLATVDKPFDLAADLETEIDDLCDALSTVGLDGVLLARGFDAHGEPDGAEPYLND